MQKLEFVLVRKNGHNNETLIDSYVEILKNYFSILKKELETLLFIPNLFQKNFIWIAMARFRGGYMKLNESQFYENKTGYCK